MRGEKKKALWGFLFLLGFSVLLLPTHVWAQELDLPKSLANLPSVFTVTGEQAKARVRRLHGKEIPMAEAAMAHFAREDEAAFLWVSEAPSLEIAADQMKRMVKKIARGHPTFRQYSSRVIGGRKVHLVYGQGQAHFFFRTGKRNVWVSVPVHRREGALKEMLEFYK